MLLLKPRNRLITFRVTIDEYEELRRTCVAFHLRSISDLARTALREMMLPSRNRGPNDMSKRISELESLVVQLKTQLEVPNGSRSVNEQQSEKDE